MAALKEIEENFEILDKENIKENKEHTANLLARLKRNRPIPVNEECECRSKITSFTEAKHSF